MAPWHETDERFYPAVSERLADWEKLHRPPFAAIRIVGDPWDPYTHRLRDALAEWRPAPVLQHRQRRGRELLEQSTEPTELPTVVVFDGRVLGRPTPAQVADALSVNTEIHDEVFVVAIVGSGPAGLAAAVYGASEGLRVVVLESQAIGAQASSSSF